MQGGWFKRHATATRAVTWVTVFLIIGISTIGAGCMDKDKNNYNPNADNDGDYIINSIEKILGSDMNNSHSFGNLHDFVRYFGYTEQIPKNISYQDLIDNPNMFEPRYWQNGDGGKYLNKNQLMEIYLSDPLFQYYDKNKINIVWENNSKYGRIGLLKFEDEPLIIFGEKDSELKNISVQPTAFLHNERKGNCVERAFLCAAIFENRNIPEETVNMILPNNRKHTVVECLIDNEVFVAIGDNSIVKRGEKGDSLYDTYNWTRRDSPEWDWYIKYL